MKKTMLIIFLSLIAFVFWKLSAIEEMTFSSKKIYDRNGFLLREIYSSEYGTAYPIKLENLPPHLINTVVVTEDKRFYYHFGVDPIAIFRAVKQNIQAGEIVSGGSTITQQLVRNMYNYPRTVPYKFLEALQSICVEVRYSKKRILEEYLNRIPYGNGAYGIEAASRLYFAKPSRDITLAESAFLSVIPRSNKLFNPYINLPSVLKKQKEILTLLYVQKKINREKYNISINENLSLFAKKNNFFAPHFCEWIIAKYKDNLPNQVKTTLDYNLQKKVEFIVNNHVSKLKHANVNNASVVVVDNSNRNILALVGSTDFFDEIHSGQLNGALSLRQPGSAIKPFVYGLSLESGFTVSDTLPDIETDFRIEGGGFYRPRNYDKKYHGMVRLRTALACSYNVATVNLASNFGPDLLLSKLHQAGFKSLKKDAEFYGLGLALGTGEVTLIELARAYSALANGGRLIDLKVLIDEPTNDMGLIFSPQVSYLLTDILSDNNAREPAFGEYSPFNLPFQCAAKTGTSKNFKDNWAIGYTPRYTVAVWVGNFSGKPMYSVSGISGAGPIFRDVMLTLEIRNKNYDVTVPDRIERKSICSKSGKLANEYCSELIEEIFIKGTSTEKICDIHRLYRIDKRNGLIATNDCPEQFVDKKVFEIYPAEYYEWVKNSDIDLPPPKISNLYSVSTSEYESAFFDIETPKDGDIFKIDPILRREYQVITLKPKIDDSILSIKWFIDDRSFIAHTYPFVIRWKIEEGKHNIKYVATRKNGEIVKSKNHRFSVID